MGQVYQATNYSQGWSEVQVKGQGSVPPGPQDNQTEIWGLPWGLPGLPTGVPTVLLP